MRPLKSLVYAVLLSSIAQISAKTRFDCVNRILSQHVTLKSPATHLLLTRISSSISCVSAALSFESQEPSRAPVAEFDESSGSCRRLGQPMFANHSPAVQQPAVKLYASSRIGEPRLALFSIKAGSGVSARSLYSTPVADCGAGGFLMLWPDSVPQVASYRSCWIDRLTQLTQLTELMPRRQLIVELLASSGARLLRIVFDASFGTNWFSKAAVLSSEPDLGLKTVTYNYFSIAGYTNLKDNANRAFYISTHHRACPSDKGLLVIIENTIDPCSWARVPAAPGIFCNLVLDEWGTNKLAADYLVVFIA